MSDTLLDINETDSERGHTTSLRQYAKQLEQIKYQNDTLMSENSMLQEQLALSKNNTGNKMASLLTSILSWFDMESQKSIMKSYLGNGKNGAETQSAEETASPTLVFDTSAGSEKYLYSINKSDAIVPPLQSNYSSNKDVSPLPTARRLFDPVLDSYRTEDMKTITTSAVKDGGNKTESTISRSQTKYIRDDVNDILSPRIHETSIKSNYSTVKTDADNPASYKRDTTARSNYSYAKDDPLEARRETNTITNYSKTKDHPDDYQHDTGSTSSFSFTKDSVDDPSSYKHETSNRSNYASIKDQPGGYKRDSTFTSNYATARKDKKQETNTKSNYTTYSFNNGKIDTKLTTQGPSNSSYFSKFSSKLDKSAKYAPNVSRTNVKSGDMSVSSIGQPVATSTPIAARSDKGKSPQLTSKRVDTTATRHNKSNTTEGAGAGQASTSITTTHVIQSDFILRPTRRMIGEIAYQLDRRILNYVFSHRSKSGTNRRFYGYVVGNLPEKILRESVNSNTGHVDENKLFVLQHRLDKILNSLRPLGYDIEHHSSFTADMVNKYGLLPPPSKERQVTIGKERKAQITEIIWKVAEPAEVKDMLTVLECLALFSNDDGQPFIIW